MSSLGDRIRHYRLGLGLTLEVLSDRSGVEVGTINALEKRGSTRSKYAKQIAEGLGLTLDQLLDESTDYLEILRRRARGEPSVSSNATPVGAVAPGSRIPVVGTAQLGDNGHFVEMDFPVGHGDGYIDLPSRDPGAYAVRCRGDSMAPRIKHGEYVVVEPATEVRPGDEVLVKSADGRVMVKQFLYRRDGRVHLVSVNDAYPPIAIDEKDIEAMHYVAAIAKASRFIEP